MKYDDVLWTIIVYHGLWVYVKLSTIWLFIQFRISNVQDRNYANHDPRDVKGMLPDSIFHSKPTLFALGVFFRLVEGAQREATGTTGGRRRRSCPVKTTLLRSWDRCGKAPPGLWSLRYGNGSNNLSLPPLWENFNISISAPESRIWRLFLCGLHVPQ